MLLMGKLTINGPFSIAMLVCQRVYTTNYCRSIWPKSRAYRFKTSCSFVFPLESGQKLAIKPLVSHLSGHNLRTPLYLIISQLYILLYPIISHNGHNLVPLYPIVSHYIPIIYPIIYPTDYIPLLYYTAIISHWFLWHQFILGGSPHESWWKS